MRGGGRGGYSRRESSAEDEGSDDESAHVGKTDKCNKSDGYVRCVEKECDSVRITDRQWNPWSLYIFRDFVVTFAMRRCGM